MCYEMPSSCHTGSERASGYHAETLVVFICNFSVKLRVMCQEDLQVLKEVIHVSLFYNNGRD